MNLLSKLFSSVRASIAKINNQPRYVSPVPRIKVSKAKKTGHSKPMNVYLGKHLPYAAQARVCSNGVFIGTSGHAPYSGPCPNLTAAQRTALKTLNA